MKKIKLSIISLLILCLVLPIFSWGCGDKKEQKTSYEIICSLNEKTLSGEETVRFFNNTDNAFSSLKFNLYGNAFRENSKFSPIAEGHKNQAYYNGINYGKMEILGVKSGEKALEFKVCGQDQNILEIFLDAQVFPNEYVEVTIKFTLELAEVIARTGINQSTINLANFYPILCGIEDGTFFECEYYSYGDPFFSDVANYTVTFTFDSSFNVASSGKVISSEIKNSLNTCVYKIDNARSFALVLSRDFEVLTESVYGVEINYYFYDDETPEKSLKTIVDSITFFSQTFGEYIYPTYSVVQTEFIQGGMEFSGLVMVSRGLEEKAHREVIIHETAHQWWQTAVGNNEVKYGFVDEGLTEYSVVLFYENHPDYGFNRKDLITTSEKTYKIFCSVYDKVFGNVNTVMTRSLKDFSSEYEYVNMAYIKPCIMLDYFRTSIGDEVFFKGLKRYYEQYKFTIVQPYTIVGVYEKLGQDAHGFFESFYEGKVIL